jgi:hypothetical protein
MTLHEIQEHFFEISDDWPAADPEQQRISVARLDDLLDELEDLDQQATQVDELRERIEALMDEIESQLDGQLVPISDDPAFDAQLDH